MMTSKLRPLGLLAAFAGAALLVAGCAGPAEVEDRERGERPETESQTVEETPEETFQQPEEADVFALSVGDCITDEDMMGTEVETVPTVPCSQPHSYEVYHDFDLSNTTFPDQGSDELLEAVSEGCLGSAFEDFVGIPSDQSEYNVMYLSPTQGSWDAGDRLVSCMIYEGDGTGNITTGSLADTAR